MGVTGPPYIASLQREGINGIPKVYPPPLPLTNYDNAGYHIDVDESHVTWTLQATMFRPPNESHVEFQLCFYKPVHQAPDQFMVMNDKNPQLPCNLSLYKWDNEDIYIQLIFKLQWGAPNPWYYGVPAGAQLSAAPNPLLGANGAVTMKFIPQTVPGHPALQSYVSLYIFADRYLHNRSVPKA